MLHGLSDSLLRKMNNFRTDPVGIVQRKVQSSFEPFNLWYRETYGFRFSRPQYDLWRFLLNREPAKLYRIERAHMMPSPVQEQVINDLRTKGISVIHFEDLFPTQEISHLQALTQMYLQKSPIREIIKAMEAGVDYAKANPLAPSGKSYLVPLLGQTPVFDVNDSFMQLCLSPELLRIASGYLQMFPRLLHIALWCNMPMAGPDIRSQRWHRDPEDRRMVKVFMYLEDVAEHNGPFCYIPETQTGSRFGKVYRQGIDRYNYPPDGAIDGILPVQPQICTGRAGTIVFCDTSGFHKGGHVTSGRRLLFLASYATSGSSWVIRRVKSYSVVGSGSTALSPAAKYALRGALSP